MNLRTASRYSPFHSAQPLGKITDVRTPGVPGFGDDLEFPRFGQFRDLAEQNSSTFEAKVLASPAKDCRQIESKTVDAHVCGPVLERVLDQSSNSFL